MGLERGKIPRVPGIGEVNAAFLYPSVEIRRPDRVRRTHQSRGWHDDARARATLAYGFGEPAENECSLTAARGATNQSHR